MPLVLPSLYAPPKPLSNPHLQTIWAGKFRLVRGVRYRRERIATFDGDFLDLDWSPMGSSRLAVICHGLEGNSTRPYVLGMVKALNQHGWDVVAMNFRGCSGEPNQRLRSYHSGATEDLQAILDHVRSHYDYSNIALVGFSLGGNLILKYLGDAGDSIHRSMRGAVAVSVPCDLAASAEQIALPANRLYLKRFLRLLREKIRAKAALFPDRITDADFDVIQDLKDFDDRYTAPYHGFQDAMDYYRKASCKPVLEQISVPTLLISAWDDPFLAPSCYPLAEAMKNPKFFLETPKWGGHVGFLMFGNNAMTWAEKRAAEFLKSVLKYTD